MKLFLALLSCAVLAAAESLLDGPTEPLRFYHETVGVAEAERIRQAEALAEADTGSVPASGQRIVGGWAASPGDYPYMGGVVITLTTGGTSVCGSSLISNTRALTAAHCWWDGRTQARLFTVVLGSIRLFSGGVRINTNNVQVHPSWNPNNLNNDIAIVTIPHTNYTNEIAAVTLPTGSLLNNNFVGWWAYAAGFGKTSDMGGITNYQYLSYVQLHVITNDVCQQSFANNISTTMLCTSGAGGINTCTGDAGGPLVVTSFNQRVLIGITSYGSVFGCTRAFPSVFTRVTAFNTWIRGLL